MPYITQIIPYKARLRRQHLIKIQLAVLMRRFHKLYIFTLYRHIIQTHSQHPHTLIPLCICLISILLFPSFVNILQLLTFFRIIFHMKQKSIFVMTNFFTFLLIFIKIMVIFFVLKIFYIFNSAILGQSSNVLYILFYFSLIFCWNESPFFIKFCLQNLHTMQNIFPCILQRLKNIYCFALHLPYLCFF